MNSSSQLSRHDGVNRGAYSNYTSENNKNRYVQDQIDDDYITTTTNNDYPSGQQQQQHYTKNSSYTGLLNRSNSYNGLQSNPGQPRVISAKQRNTSGSSLLYQVKTKIIHSKKKKFVVFI